MSEKKSTIIIGGGVIGACCAYYLQQKGRKVTILEKDRFAAACSHGNCGYVCPSHVIPLASPGAIKSTFWALFKPNSPFSIKPRFDRKLWSWLFQFAMHCNEKQMLAGGHALKGLLHSSMNEFERLATDGTIECEWQKKGLMYVYRDATRFESYTVTNRMMTETFDEPATRYSSSELEKLEPALKPGLAGAWLYEQDAHIRSDVLMNSWRKRLEEGGVEIQEDVHVKSFQRTSEKAVALSTSQGDFTADDFVVATGALTPFLEKELGCKIPIQPGKGYSITMPKPEVCPEFPMIFPEHRVAVTPFKSGYRLGSVMEFAGYDESIKQKRIDLLKNGAAIYLKDPFREPIEERWFGWRPMTYDSLPIIDRTPQMDNVFIAAGHNMIGLSMSTGTGKLVAEMVAGEKPHLDPTPFSVKRF